MYIRGYDPNMRSFRAYQLFWRAHGDFALDQVRRLFDVVIALPLLTFTAPLMVFAALAIKIETPGPILVKEACIGLGGRRFRMLRFRTVVHDPDGTVPNWARKATPVGEFLRYTRIEAIPQLINVLRGEMSIIDLDGIRSPSFLD
jgi:lipopolysaccharide/colanic/teichoic acid biosynthesis glycosyltransferase